MGARTDLRRTGATLVDSGTVPHSQTASEVIIMYEDMKGGKYQKSINPS